MEADALTLNIEQEVLRWPGITATPGGFGASAFRYKEREIGHLHRQDRIANLSVAGLTNSDTDKSCSVKRRVAPVHRTARRGEFR